MQLYLTNQSHIVFFVFVLHVNKSRCNFRLFINKIKLINKAKCIFQYKKKRNIPSLKGT